MKKAPIKKKPYKWKVKQNPIMILWSKCVKTRDGFKCQLCGATEGVMHAHHFIGRRKAQTKYLVEVGICLCFTCHNEVGDYSGVNEELFIKTVGSIRKEELEVLSRIIGRKLDKEAIKTGLKEKLQIMEDE